RVLGASTTATPARPALNEKVRYSFLAWTAIVIATWVYLRGTSALLERVSEILMRREWLETHYLVFYYALYPLLTFAVFFVLFLGFSRLPRRLVAGPQGLTVRFFWRRQLRVPYDEIVSVSASTRAEALGPGLKGLRWLHFRPLFRSGLL